MQFKYYDFNEIYHSDLKEMNFDILASLLTNWIEIEFRYKWEDYFIVNWPSRSDSNKENSYWFFWKEENRVNKFSSRICLVEENDRFIEFIANFMIDWLSLKEIFDEKMSYSEKQDKDNCMTRIS